MSTENEIREIVSRYTRAADRRDGEALAKLYEADAVVEIHYRGPDGMELLGTLSGGAQIAAAMSTAMAPHPPLGWSHHTTYDHLVSVDGDEASIETQFITFDVVGTRKPEGGWPAGTFGAQGTIKPIESGYYRFTFRRTDGVWRIRHLDVITRHPLRLLITLRSVRPRSACISASLLIARLPLRRQHSRGSALNQEVVPGMATLGLIGSGHIGGTLARLAVDAGLDVVLSNSRGPQTLSDLVDELGPRARAATPAQAAAAGDWVVVTIPVGAVGTVPREPLVGKTVIDTGNYFAPRDGTIPELEAQELTDSEMLQRHLAEAHVVKAFNNINYQHLGPCRGPWTRPTAPPCRSPATTRAQRSTPPSCSRCSGTTPWTWDRSPKAGAHKWALRSSARPTR